MNILQVVPELNAGGVERTTIEIAQALSAAGHVPHVASAGGRLEDELRAAGGVLHRLNIGSKNPLSLRANTRALIKLIKTHNIDLVHARSRAPAWPASAAAKAAGVPFITTYHGIYNAKSRLKRRYNAVMAKGDIIIANSNFTKDHIIAEHGTPPAQITVIPRGVDMKLFDPHMESKADIKAMRKKWGISGKLPVLLLPGRLTRWKGQMVAIKALALLPQKGTAAELVLLGDAQGRDDYVAELEDEISRLGLGELVHIVGHCRDMPCAYSSCDIVLSASTDPEAFGRVAAEGQAMHRLVIASAHGGALETIVDGETGVLVPPGDPDILSLAISNLLAKSAVAREKMGVKARARIGREFSAASLKAATLDVYQKAIAAK